MGVFLAYPEGNIQCVEVAYNLATKNLRKVS
jgi:hypothetical protein